MFQSLLVFALSASTALSWCRMITYDGFGCGGTRLGTHHTYWGTTTAFSPGGGTQNDWDEGTKILSFFVQGECKKILIAPTTYNGRRMDSMLDGTGLYINDKNFLRTIPGYDDDVDHDPNYQIGILGTGKTRLEEKCHDTYDIKFFDVAGAFILNPIQQEETGFGEVVTDDSFPELKDCGTMDHKYYGKVQDLYKKKCEDRNVMETIREVGPMGLGVMSIVGAVLIVALFVYQMRKKSVYDPVTV